MYTPKEITIQSLVTGLPSSNYTQQHGENSRKPNKLAFKLRI